MDSQTKPHVLLVDDEQALTRLMQTYLTKIGYTVDTALVANDALAAFGHHPASYELVVADLTLPDMPGNEMALRMVDMNPRVRVLLCSGYPFAVESLPAEVQNRFATLQKPFLPNMPGGDRRFDES